MKLLKGVEFRLGTETHTFTAIGRCPRTGRLGVAVTTSEIGTGGRAPHVKANVGAVGTQAYTDPRLGILALQLLELGYPAGRVLSELEASDPHIEWRQLGIVDRWGHTAVRTGANNSEWAGHKTGDGWDHDGQLPGGGAGGRLHGQGDGGFRGRGHRDAADEGYRRRHPGRRPAQRAASRRRHRTRE